MSLEVFRYLSDSGGNFTENLPTSQRPPVPGEENDNSSNDGKGSQCSRSGESSLRCTNEKSPAATPRRSNLYPNHHTLDPSKKQSMTDEEAPLGFEPEGSASVTPPYTRWTESLHALLGDDDGIRLFKQFLNQEKAEDPLLFWLATEGFKKKPAEDPKRSELAKVIYRRFVKCGGQQAVKITPANRTLIEESVRKCSFDHTLFDVAQGEVEETIRETTYPLFLKSDLYVQYINNGGISPKSSEGSSSSGNNSRVPGLLPTLPEDAELIDIPRDELPDINKPVPLTSEMLIATSSYRSGGYNKKEGHYLKGSSRQLMSPYHASYAAYAPAASANDSEIQSLSSDAISDDTMSQTDSSVDGAPISRHSRQQRRRQQRAMKTSIRQNGKVASFPPFPHMQRPQKEVQPVAPNEFARILTEKLERVVQEREAQERLVARLKEVEGSECEADISSSTMTTEGAPVVFNNNAGDGGSNVVEDDPNSILDEHCSRVFMDGQSPGNFSPRQPKSPPERARRAKSAGSIPGMPQMPPGYTKQMLQKHRSKSKDALARGDRDSAPQDYIDADLPVHHKYHHHYYLQKSKHQIELDATRRTMAVYAQDGTEQTYDKKYSAHSDTGVSSYPYDAVYVDTGKYKKKSSSSKKSDISSISKTTDSGIYEGPPSLPSDSEKNTSIEQWIRHGEQYSYPSKKGTSSRGREQQHKRSAHRLPNDMPMSSSMSPHRPTHTASKRATLAYNTSRPGSVERPYTPTNPLHVHSKRSVPSQPIMQDPSMPLNPPPDSMTLLEEVRRRIESSSKQQKLRHQEASRSKERRSSSNSSNQGTMRTSSSSNGSTRGTLRVTSAPVKITSPDNPEEHLPGASSSNNGKKTTSSSSSTNRHSTPAAGAEQKTTVTVAYYFCNDPIPYRTTLPGEHVTLAQFKTLITKRGNYRYTFKTPSDEFDTGVVHEIISDDNAILPIFHGKIIGKVEKID